MSGHSRNGGKITHDAGDRISWSNRPPISVMKDNAVGKRAKMKQVCSHCHSKSYVNAFYKQYDDFLVLYNEKFAKPGTAIMKILRDHDLITSNIVLNKKTNKKAKKSNFDEEIEWTWFYLWHHEGRRARHGASMMAPDYAHWHGMYEVAERFYMELIPQAKEIAHRAESKGKKVEAGKVETLIDTILSHPEHLWFQKSKGRPKLPMKLMK